MFKVLDDPRHKDRAEHVAKTPFEVESALSQECKQFVEDAQMPVLYGVPYNGQMMNNSIKPFRSPLGGDVKRSTKL